MPEQNLIKCPNCGHEFAADKAIFLQAEQKLKLEFDQKIAEKDKLFRQQQQLLEQEKKQLAKDREEQEIILSEKLKIEKNKLMKAAEAKIKEEFELEIALLKSENEKRKEENKQLKQKELELLQKEKALQEKAEEQNLELEKKLIESRQQIAHDFEQKIAEREKQFHERQISLENEKKLLSKAKEEQETKLQEKLQDEKEKLTKIAEQKAKEKFELELASLQEENSKRKEENKLLKQKELELLKKAESLKEKEEELELELERKLQESREKIAQEMRHKEQEKSELKFREYEKKLEDQKKLIDEMKRKAEQGSMQMQGEIQELALEELLQFKFPFDTIEEVAKGVKGADVIQNVRNKMQQNCGKIIYESKRTKAFNDEWLEKLKADQLSQKADLAVIVTETMPRDMQKFGLKDGVWVCAFHEVESVAFVLREMLIKMSYIKAAEENKSGKMEMLYDFLTGNEFRQQIEAIVEGFSQMKDDLEKEKRAFAAQWKKREKQIDKVISNTIAMYGSVRGIAGNAIAAISSLELPEPTLELE